MDRAAVEQLLDEMLSSLEDLETKAGATLQFLKDKGMPPTKISLPISSRRETRATFAGGPRGCG